MSENITEETNEIETDWRVGIGYIHLSVPREVPKELLSKIKVLRNPLYNYEFITKVIDAYEGQEITFTKTNNSIIGFNYLIKIGSNTKAAAESVNLAIETLRHTLALSHLNSVKGDIIPKTEIQYFVDKINEPKYSEADMRQCFKAAKGRIFKQGIKSGSKQKTFSTFEDYINSLK